MQKNSLQKNITEFLKKNLNQKILKTEIYKIFANIDDKKIPEKKLRKLKEEKKYLVEEYLWVLSNVGLVQNDKKFIKVGNKFSFQGRISITRRGDGFVEIAKDLEAFVPVFFTESAMNGDLVEIEPIGVGKKDRIECRVTKILKKGRILFRMKVTSLDGNFFEGKILDLAGTEKFALLNKKSILTEIKNSISIDDVLVVKQKENSEPVDDSIEVSFIKIENGKNSDIDLDRILMKYNLIQSHPDYKDLKLPEEVIESEIEDFERRVDLRDLYTITIDGETAKDFDDAISFIEEEKKIRFYVHIADVSYYVKKNSALDKEAFSRATSVYLANRVVPMLPPELSENLCSLVANKNRLAFTVEMEADYKGKIYSAKFYKSIIKVNERYTYERAETEIKNSPETNWLNKIMKLANALKKQRIQSGRIDLNFKETYILEDPSNPKNVQIKIRERLNSHILIEEMMLSANTKVAEFLRKKKVNTLYRIHESMDEDKLEKLNDLLKLYGFKTRIKTVEYEDLKKALETISGHKSEKIFNYFLLRSFMQAYYGGEAIGHWGLGFRDYCHFTSPIRRYPDLVCHRALEKILIEEEAYSKDEILEMGNHCSKEERKAAEAERDILKLKACRLIDSIGVKEFKATITGIKPHLVYVELDEYLTEGAISYVHFTNEIELKIMDDFSFYSKKYTKSFFLGDKLDLQLEKIDFEEIKIFLKF